MYIFYQTLMLLGGITMFMLGLKYMSNHIEYLAGDSMKQNIGKLTKNKCLGVLTGAGFTAVAQSSVAIDMIVVSFVNKGMMSLYQAGAVIMGANIGTTITAQLIALSGSSEFSITAIASLVMFIGFLLSLSINSKKVHVANVLIGFGLLFVGIEIMGNSIDCFKGFAWFRNIFLVDNPLVLLLNGIILTALVQSSSAVTSFMIILATSGMVGFESAMFVIMGANIGTSFAVVVVSLNKNITAFRASVFNLLFNVLGCVILFFPLVLFASEISTLMEIGGKDIARKVANFHTLFNITVTLILLPLLKPFTKFIEYLIPENATK